MTDDTSQEVGAVEEVAEAIEEQIEQKEEEIKEVKAEPDDNAERSQLGRKVKTIETTLMSELTALRSELAELKQRPQPEVDMEAIATVADIDQRLEQRDKEKQDALVKYQSAYTQTAYNLLTTLSDEEANEVEKELFENHDKILSNNASQDAKTNFQAAYISVLKQSQRKNPLKGESPQGINNGSKVKGQTQKVQKLSPDAKKFAEKMGKSAEWIEEAMSEA